MVLNIIAQNVFPFGKNINRFNLIKFASQDVLRVREKGGTGLSREHYKKYINANFYDVIFFFCSGT